MRAIRFDDAPATVPDARSVEMADEAGVAISGPGFATAGELADAVGGAPLVAITKASEMFVALETAVTVRAKEEEAAAETSFAPGLYPGVSEAVYHRRTLGIVSKSALDYVAKTPASYLAWVNGLERKETKALRLGKAIHCGLLEPAKFALMYVVAPDFGDGRTKEAKRLKSEWAEEHEGAIVLSAAEGAMLTGVLASVKKNELACKMLEEGEPELTVRWTCEDTGLLCKARPDFYVKRHNFVVDVKSTIDASPAGFAKAVGNYGYHRQEAHYRDGMATVGSRLDHFVFLACEKEPPYLIGLYTVDAAALALGQRSIERDKFTLKGCLERDEWPGYEPGIRELSLPAWMK